MLHDAFIAHSSFQRQSPDSSHWLWAQLLFLALQANAVSVDVVIAQTAAAAVVESMV